MDRRFAAAVTIKAQSDQGTVEAVFSTADVVDVVGDRVLSSAFKDGQHVPMVWAHDWSRPVGRGTVRVEPARAIFLGRFFTETIAGRDAYLTVKAMGDLQEWSFAFQTTGDRSGDDGERVITGLDLFEVSPVLVGANRSTHTLAIKEGRRNSGGDLERIQQVHDLAGDLGADCSGAKGRRAQRRADPALLAIKHRLQGRGAVAELLTIKAQNDQRRIRDLAGARRTR